MYIYIHTLHYITLHCITLHYIALNYITLYYIALHYITLRYITLHCITLHCIALHSITLHCIALHVKISLREDPCRCQGIWHRHLSANACGNDQPKCATTMLNPKAFVQGIDRTPRSGSTNALPAKTCLIIARSRTTTAKPANAYEVETGWVFQLA